MEVCTTTININLFLHNLFFVTAVYRKNETKVVKSYRNKENMSFNSNIRPSSQFTFKDHHICDLARDHEKENLKCICKACKIQGNLLPYIKIVRIE